MMRPDDRLISPTRGTIAQVVSWCETLSRGVDGFLGDYLREVYRLAPLIGIDASITIAQSAHECFNPQTGKPWDSYWYRARGNVAGIGITGTPSQDAQSRTWTNGTDAARSQLAHLLVYAVGPVEAAKRWADAVPDQSIVEVDPRYSAYVSAYGNTAAAETIAELTGRWAVDPDYAAGVCARGNAIYPTIPNQTTGGPTVPSKRPVIVIDAGHRSTDRSGNPAEMSMTDDLAVAYCAAFRAAGYEAYWWQRDLDKDSDPDETVGTLTTVSVGIGAYLAKLAAEERDSVLLSCHYNGAHSPLHVIVPDVGNLTPGIAGGAPRDDTAVNNGLDVRLAREIASRAKAAGLGTLFTGKLGLPGLMSEQETGVGLDGWRLGLFAGTAKARAKAVRLIVEHGGTSDPAAKRFGDWAAVAVAAVNEVYEVTGEPTPIPEPEPAKPHPLPLRGSYIDANGNVWMDYRKSITPPKAIQTYEYADPTTGTGPILKAGKAVTVYRLTTVERDGKAEMWGTTKLGWRFLLDENALPQQDAA